MEPDGKNFFNEVTLKLILQTFNWDYCHSLMDYCKEGDKWEHSFVPFRADFYPEGALLARSDKAIIKSVGKTIIHYRNERFLTGWGIYDRFGIDGMNDIESWDFEEEKEWTITKFNGEWVTTFTELTQCPFRTTIRC